MSKLCANDIVKVVMALTGEIEAYGSSGIDRERYENQDVLEDVVYKLVGKIYDNTFYANRVEGSIDMKDWIHRSLYIFELVCVTLWIWRL